MKALLVCIAILGALLAFVCMSGQFIHYANTKKVIVLDYNDLVKSAEF